MSNVNSHKRKCCDCGFVHLESECKKVKNYEHGVDCYDHACPKCLCKEYYPIPVESNKPVSGE